MDIQVNGKPVSVDKLPLKKYADLLASFEELPKHFNLIDGKTNEEILQNLPALISKCYPDIVRVLKVATSLTDDQIDAMGLDDLIQVLTAIFEVNRYGQVYEQIKKLTARPQIALGMNGSGGQ